jgi:23S rRNA pseudouridine1911/1915/1917 synthase
LHAATLGFTHPVTGERMHFRSALPAELTHLLSLLEEEDTAHERLH